MTSGRTTAFLVTTGAAVVLAGLLGGWAATRALSGQSPLTTVTVATDTVTLRAYTDDLGFTAQVPEAWTEDRDDRSVSFVSPDGSEELTVARARSAEEVLAGLTAAALDTADLRPDPPQALDGGATQVVYRTADDDGVHRTGWLRIVPVADGVLAVRLTAPGGSSESVSAELFDVVADAVGPAH